MGFRLRRSSRRSTRPDESVTLDATVPPRAGSGSPGGHGGKRRSSVNMNAQQLITWLVVGLIAGWLASWFVGGPSNVLGYLVAGLIGGFVGSWLFNAMGWRLNLGNDIVEAIITSAIGAGIVILLAKLVGVLL
jgi:uncharacterized membrane protein YeaQ/YmgE (transglycosylase-associated protein family)